MAKRIASKNNIFTNKKSFWIYKKLKLPRPSNSIDEYKALKDKIIQKIENHSINTPLLTVSNIMPILSNNSDKLFPLIITPIEPVIVPGFATILSDATPM